MPAKATARAAMFDAGKQLTPRDTIASQFASHDHRRHVLQTLQPSLEEPLCSVGIAPRLDKDIQHNAILRPSPTIVDD